MSLFVYFMCKDALNVLHETLITYLFLKQQPDAPHNLLNLG